MAARTQSSISIPNCPDNNGKHKPNLPVPARMGRFLKLGVTMEHIFNVTVQKTERRKQYLRRMIPPTIILLCFITVLIILSKYSKLFSIASLPPILYAAVRLVNIIVEMKRLAEAVCVVKVTNAGLFLTIQMKNAEFRRKIYVPFSEISRIKVYNRSVQIRINEEDAIPDSNSTVFIKINSQDVSFWKELCRATHNNDYLPLEMTR